MSWFSTPSEYKRYADGRVEIVHRRSVLKIGLAALGALAVAGGTAAVVMTTSPMGGTSGEDLSRHPELTQQVVARILEEQDHDALYRILGHYDSLDPVERTQFWRLAVAFKLKDLRPFAERAVVVETYPLAKAKLELFLRTSR
ncbi:MAG: hypothetical protein RL885_03805 [Planctomycetota bacterium]